MPTNCCTIDPVTMDTMQPNPLLYYGVNGAHKTQPCEDEALQFLSVEEKECILFFEETIDSLGEGLEDEREEPGEGPPSVSETPAFQATPTQAQSPASATARSPSPHDIIDLVHSTPDLNPDPDLVHSAPREAVAMPDFQSLAVVPDAHFELKAKREPLESFPAEYHLPLPSAPPVPGQDNGYQPPPGSIPTPVLIAHRIAEGQGAVSGGAGLCIPSLLVQRQSSLDSHHSRPGGPPPTSARPPRFPGNVSRELGQAVAAACVRNVPTRSVSFRDPTPDKSRMEALSKLGLTRGRALSFNPAPAPAGGGKGNETTNPSGSADPKSKQLRSEVSKPTLHCPDPKHPGAPGVGKMIPETTLGPRHPATSAGVSQVKVCAAGDFAPTDCPAASNHDNKSPVSAEVSASDFNPYGGKTVTVVPASSLRSKPEPDAHARAQAPSQPNTYGGRSRVVTPSAGHTDAPDGPESLRCHDSSAAKAARHPAPPPSASGLNSYGGKSKIFSPSSAAAKSHAPDDQRGRRDSGTTPSEASASEGTARPVLPPSAPPQTQPDSPVKSRPAKLPPSTAPKPTRNNAGPPSPQRGGPAPPSCQEGRRTSLSKGSFRSQGITVQFSGRGATDESRREALRKLGLLKDTA